MGDGVDCLPGIRAVEAKMPGKSTLTADAAEQAALRALSKSEQRDEADRARAILLTLEGATGRGDRRSSGGASMDRTFADLDALDRAIPDAIARLNHEQQSNSS